MYSVAGELRLLKPTMMPLLLYSPRVKVRRASLSAALSLVVGEVDEASAALCTLIDVAEHTWRHGVERTLQRGILIHPIVEKEGAAFRGVLEVGIGASSED